MWVREFTKDGSSVHCTETTPAPDPAAVVYRVLRPLAFLDELADTAGGTADLDFYKVLGGSLANEVKTAKGNLWWDQKKLAGFIDFNDRKNRVYLQGLVDEPTVAIDQAEAQAIAGGVLPG